MAKELPYFRFTASEWQNGKISLESYELQGFFMNVCCYYWSVDCSLALATLEKKFRHDKKLINSLINNEIIKYNSENDLIQITFLNEQFDVLSEKRKKLQEAGRLGGLSKASEIKVKNNPSDAKANASEMLKKNPSYKDKDKDKDKDNIIETAKAVLTHKQPSIIDTIIEIFAEEYKQSRDLQYFITNKGKESSAAGKLLNIFKKHHPEYDSEKTLTALREYFKRCLDIHEDAFIRDNMNLSLIINKFNEINNILKNGKTKRNNQPKPISDAERIAAIADGWQRGQQLLNERIQRQVNT